MVTFRTDNHRDISMFNSDAHTMLKLMGLSTTVPSALLAEDVPAALERLQNAIEMQEPIPESAGEEEEDDEHERPIPLKTRALPLLDLLATAARSNDRVMWE